MKKYNHKLIEKKWQLKWDKNGIYKAKDFSKKEKYYCLIEFPYPSGAGLHVGHLRSHIAIDIVARKKRMGGRNVLYPIGWDAFGLPTENFAIKTKTHPKIVTKNNIKNFTRQIKSYGPSFDWSREINTTDPEYYKWTQWIFLKFYNSFYDEKTDKALPIEKLEVPTELNGLEKRKFIDDRRLAYEAQMAINWCPSCKIGLANEEVVNGNCERCGMKAEKKLMKQWMLRITKYADRLIRDLDTVDYLEKIKTQQVNWIGKSEGTEIDFRIKDSDSRIKIFTTRVDTIFGCTYVVLAPENPLIESLKNKINNLSDVTGYINAAKNKPDLDRTDLAKDKTGMEIKGIIAINPFNDEEIPVWVADYVLGSYGTGAVMAVPAHDERDWYFAKKYNLPIRSVILAESAEARSYPASDKPTEKTSSNANEQYDKLYTEDGILAGSGQFTRLKSADARDKMSEWIQAQGLGQKKINFKLRDWVFSRQHYWGEPIPIIKCPKCGNVPLSEKDLPLELPEVKNYEPTDTGESPLANIKKWVDVKCPICGETARRETDTMPNWAGSSWYFLRYLDPKNNKEFASRKKIEYWMSVDLYNGGMEHTTLHLLYSRFWHKFLFDLGYVNTAEPYKMRRSHGMILAENGEKMSKSRGNVVNPDEVIKKYGADTVRLYEMFMGPYGEAIPWSTGSLIGMSRFLDRVWNLQKKVNTAKLKAKDKSGIMLVATNNQGKLKELKEHFKNYKILSLKDIKKKIKEPVENGKTFEDNSLIKARYYAKKTGFVAIADDSGLCVNALGGRPGVYSSRYAGHNDKKGYIKLLGELEGKSDRSAFFKSVITIYNPETDAYKQFEGRCDGDILNEARGGGGFGYDPVFMPKGSNKSFGESSPEEKFKFDHRKKAVDKLDVYLKEKESQKKVIESIVHRTIKKVTEDIDNLKFNTAISSLMILTNELEKSEDITSHQYSIFLTLLSPFAPHITEELWQLSGNRKTIHLQSWPKYDPNLAKENEVELVIQINGKLRERISVPAGISEEEAKNIALGSDKVKKWIEGKQIRKIIFARGRLLNIVI